MYFEMTDAIVRFFPAESTRRRRSAIDARRGPPLPRAQLSLRTAPRRRARGRGARRARPRRRGAQDHRPRPARHRRLRAHRRDPRPQGPHRAGDRRARRRHPRDLRPGAQHDLRGVRHRRGRGRGRERDRRRRQRARLLRLPGLSARVAHGDAGGRPLGTKAGVERRPFTMRAPLIRISVEKSEIILRRRRPGRRLRPDSLVLRPRRHGGRLRRLRFLPPPPARL